MIFTSVSTEVTLIVVCGIITRIIIIIQVLDRQNGVETTLGGNDVSRIITRFRDSSGEHVLIMSAITLFACSFLLICLCCPRCRFVLPIVTFEMMNSILLPYPILWPSNTPVFTFLVHYIPVQFGLSSPTLHISFCKHFGAYRGLEDAHLLLFCLLVYFGRQTSNYVFTINGDCCGKGNLSSKFYRTRHASPTWLGRATS